MDNPEILTTQDKDKQYIKKQTNNENTNRQKNPKQTNKQIINEK